MLSQTISDAEVDVAWWWGEGGADAAPDNQ